LARRSARITEVRRCVARACDARVAGAARLAGVAAGLAAAVKAYVGGSTASARRATCAVVRAATGAHSIRARERHCARRHAVAARRTERATRSAHSIRARCSAFACFTDGATRPATRAARGSIASRHVDRWRIEVCVHRCIGGNDDVTRWRNVGTTTVGRIAAAATHEHERDEASEPNEWSAHARDYRATRTSCRRDPLAASRASLGADLRAAFGQMRGDLVDQVRE
jgi:hypothetical protein